MPAPSKPKRGQVEAPEGEMEILQVSQSPLRGASHVDFRADLVQHHARVERLLSQMLGKILGRSELSCHSGLTLDLTWGEYRWSTLIYRSYQYIIEIYCTSILGDQDERSLNKNLWSNSHPSFASNAFRTLNDRVLQAWDELIDTIFSNW